jgi:chitin-binding protein
VRKRRKITLATTAAVLSALFATVLTVLNASPASAHGAMMIPGSRTFFCWEDGLTPQGNIVPQNPACAAAVAQSGTTSLYNWFAVLRSDGSGRMQGFIPDGKLCSGAATVYDFSGYDLARNDWPVTHLTSGGNIQIRYNKWAAHPGSWRLYITKDSWSPTRPLAWSDLESQPFTTVTDPPSIGSPGSVDSYYYWNATLPAGKTGRHLIYSVWTRSDSAETFYGCSDVVFDGGNGTVTGIGGGGTTPPPSSPPPSSPPPSSPPPSSPPPSSPPPTNGACAATYRTTNSWPGGFQGEVTVTNPGTAGINGWTVGWTLASGTTISSLWNGTYTTSGSSVTVKNANYNGSIAAKGTTTFGFVANSTGGPTAPTLTCASP